MKANEGFSDERLNAFVDDQLGPAEREEILAAAADDTDLNDRLCALRATRELVRHAYGEPPPPVRRSARSPRVGTALAASVALAVGVAIGWLGHHEWGGRDGMLLAAQPAAMEPARILIHLDNDSAEHMDAALALAETYLAKSGQANVEIIANNRGLDLLRSQTTPYARRIAAMKVQHQQLGFIACGQTIARLRGQGEDVGLVPEAAVTRTAIEHVAERVQQGWTYLKI